MPAPNPTTPLNSAADQMTSGKRIGSGHRCLKYSQNAAGHGVKLVRAWPGNRIRHGGVAR